MSKESARLLGENWKSRKTDTISRGWSWYKNATVFHMWIKDYALLPDHDEGASYPGFEFDYSAEGKGILNLWTGRGNRQFAQNLTVTDLLIMGEYFSTLAALALTDNPSEQRKLIVQWDSKEEAEYVFSGDFVEKSHFALTFWCRRDDMHYGYHESGPFPGFNTLYRESHGIEISAWRKTNDSVALRDWIENPNTTHLLDFAEFFYVVAEYLMEYNRT